MNFSIKIENNNNNIGNNLNFVYIHLKKMNTNKNLLFIEYYKKVSNEKEKIDKLENSEYWDKMKKIGNPYELIYTTYNKRKKSDSISLYIPISRSYFKMWEIYYNYAIFKKFDHKDDFVFAHLAEGPGGFMEASYNYRQKMNNNNNDIYFGITLKPTNDYIPDWNKIKKIFNNDNNIYINYGNLYFIEDVINYISHFKDKKANVVTADGGFDYSNNFNGQEINSCQIIYSEFVVALNVLKKGGSFICKVFDLFSFTMIQLLYFINLFFEEVHIYKPDTSRPANSEKYLICLYYKNNLSNDQQKYLLKNIELWNNIVLKENESIMFDNIKVDNWFIQKLNEYNNKYMNLQLFYLNNVLKLVENKVEKAKYYNMIKEQVNNAIEWCSKYDIEINTNSIYYKKNI